MAVLITDLVCQIVNHIVSIIYNLQAPRNILSVHVSHCVVHIEIYENVDIVVLILAVFLVTILFVMYVNLTTNMIWD